MIKETDLPIDRIFNGFAEWIIDTLMSQELDCLIDWCADRSISKIIDSLNVV